MSHRSRIMPGSTFKTYHVLEKLNQGTMGTVYKVKNGKNIFALKTFLDDSTHGDEFKVRFQEEVDALLSINHPNIVRIFDVQANYYTMEFLPLSLKDYLPLASYLDKNYSERPYAKDIETRLKWLRQILDGIVSIHDTEPGYLHRDICPNNIRLTDKEVPKICDFGLVGRNRNKSTIIKELREYEKRPNPKLYAAPEQEIALGNCTEQSDIYTFGLITHQFLSGHIPKGIDPKSLHTYLTDNLPGTIPTRLEEIVSKCLKHNAEDRFSTAKEALKVFDELLWELSVYKSANDRVSIPNSTIPAWFDEVVSDSVRTYGQRYCEDYSVSIVLKKTENDYVYLCQIHYDYKKVLNSRTLRFVIKPIRNATDHGEVDPVRYIQNEFYYVMDERVLIKHVGPSELDKYYKISTICINNEEFVEPIRQQEINSFSYVVEVPHSVTLTKPLKLSYTVEFPVEVESFIAISIELPTKFFTCNLDYTDIKNSVDLSAATFLSSNHEPLSPTDSRDGVIEYKHGRWILPKSSAVFMWWKK